MEIKTIHNFEDYYTALKQTGFTMGGENSEGILTLADHFSDQIEWHTGTQKTDPWAWRMRVLKEKDDIAYSKVFFKKGGYITKEWYPYFLSARRQNRTLDDMYQSGKVSSMEKEIYDILMNDKQAALHQIKSKLSFSGQSKSKIDTALTNLQMNLFITICGETQKLSSKGEPYGWPVTVLCTTEDFWGRNIFDQAAKISKEDAVEKIKQQILKLNPKALEKTMSRFIGL